MKKLWGSYFRTNPYNRGAWIKKDGEYWWIIFWPGWELTLEIKAQRSYDSDCGHYFFSSNEEEYTAASYYWVWTEYSEDSDYYNCPICHHRYIITYEVHGRFSYYADSSNYYDITLAIEYEADPDSIDATFGPFINHLKGIWLFHEDSGIET